MTKSEINRLAKKLKEKILAEIRRNPELTYEEILNYYLAEYNEEVQAGILDSLSKMKSDIPIGTAVMSGAVISAPELSSRLYANAKDTAKAVKKVLDTYIATKATIEDIRKALYDGYGYEELLPIKKDAPGFLRKKITPEAIARLKTKPLKAAYLKVLDATTERELEKALKIAVEEKSRYYALRIASTEEAKAFTLGQVAGYLEEGVQFVKWTLSPRHSLPCVCDLYATMNVGWGPGIYPIMDAPMPVYSSHPFCQCKLVKIEPKKMKYSADPVKTALEKFPAKDRRAVAYGFEHGWGYTPVKKLF